MVGHFHDPMGASYALFPPFSVIEIAPQSISHLIHALEKNSAVVYENIDPHVIVSSKDCMCVRLCKYNCNYVRNQSQALVLLLGVCCGNTVSEMVHRWHSISVRLYDSELSLINQ